MEIFQSAQDNRFLRTEEAVKPEPNAFGAAERAPDYVIPYRDQLRSLAGQELARRHPPDIVLCFEQAPGLIGFAAVFDQFPRLLCPQADVRGDLGEQARHLPTEGALKQVQSNRD